jgi:hypothetical protein
VRRGSGRARAVLVGAALALSLAINAVLMLPLVPVTALGRTPIPDIDYDAGEQVGWPRFAATLERASRDLLDTPFVVLTGNYGEAGAVDRYAPDLGPAYSGHNSYWSWGPPPADVDTALVVGLSEDELRRWFGTVERAAVVDNGVDLDNDEQGTQVWIARDRLMSWSEIWPQLRRLG